MQNNFNNLTKELELLKKKIISAPSLLELSSKDFSKYQLLINKKEQLEAQILKLSHERDKILESYTRNNENWLYDDKMNCKKYCRLEQKAAYSRDKKLYNLGFIDSKPTLPSIKKLTNFISSKILEPTSNKLSPIKPILKQKLDSTIQNFPIYQAYKKLKNLTTNTLPIKATNLAISGTKHCIIGYRCVSNSLYSFSRNISSVPIIQIISYINTQAKKEANLQSSPFLSRIRVNPNNSISHFQNSKIKSTPDLNSYDLAL